MPEFQLDPRDATAMARFQALDDFTQGYIEAAFFTSTGSSDDGDMADATLADLSEHAWWAMRRDCGLWWAAAGHYVAAANEKRAGHDFWFTRNGHGVGFWETGRWPDPEADYLAAVSRIFGEWTLYRGDDGLIYGMRG